jgi:hypothetical protein
VRLRQHCGALLEIDDIRKRLGLIGQSYSGVHPIPLDHIVGTVGRGNDFDRCFNPLRPDLRKRLRRVKDAFKDGSFPSIDAFRIDSAYFVSDGHHRVAAALQMGMAAIDANVTLVHSPYRIGPDVEMDRIILTEHERRFLKDSGLSEVRPKASIPLSTPDGYSELLEVLRAYGFELVQTRQEVLPHAAVAAIWYDCIYLPTIRFSLEEGLCDLLPSCTLGDLFLAVHRQHRTAFGVECPAAEDAIREAVHQEFEDHAPRRSRPMRRPAASPAPSAKPLDHRRS